MEIIGKYNETSYIEGVVIFGVFRGDISQKYKSPVFYTGVHEV